LGIIAEALPVDELVAPIEIVLVTLLGLTTYWTGLCLAPGIKFPKIPDLLSDVSFLFSFKPVDLTSSLIS